MSPSSQSESSFIFTPLLLPSSFSSSDSDTCFGGVASYKSSSVLWLGPAWEGPAWEDSSDSGYSDLSDHSDSASYPAFSFSCLRITLSASSIAWITGCS